MEPQDLLITLDSLDSRAFQGVPSGNIANWKDPPCFIGKSTISTGSFSIAIWVCLKMVYTPNEIAI